MILLSPKKILIVDDTPVNIDVLYLHLQEEGYTVLVANDGTEAIATAQNTKPDLIILDILMPGLDGFQVAAKLKEIETTADIPIIFMSALTDTDNKIKGFNVGGVDYITKPFRHREVLVRVHTQLMVRQQQQELEVRERELQEQNEDLDAFAHTVAHDLKNPLQIILLHTELLQYTESLTVKGDQYADVILKTTLKMHSIIDELQRLAWIRKDKIEIAPIHMHDHVDQALNRLQNMIDEYKPEIQMPDTCPTAQGYGPWIEEVWMNYLGNGMKYGGSPPLLTIGSEDQGNGYIRFWVRDNGDGVSPEDQARIFERSVQLGNKGNDGYGLGLSIAKRIIEKLDGEVGITSVDGQGSEFYFTLPVALI